MTPIKRSTSRVTLGHLDGLFGPDNGRRLVVTLKPDDLIVLRPEKTRRAETVSLFDVYRFALQARMSKWVREQAMKRRSKLAWLRKAKRLKRAEERLTKKL